MKHFKTFKLNVVSPEKLFYSNDVAEVVVPGEIGEFGILSDHESMISSLKAGLLEIRLDDKNSNSSSEYLFITGGFANISDNVCSILAEDVVHVSELSQTDLEKNLRDISENIQMARSDEERESLITDQQIVKAKLDIIKRLTKK